MGLQTNYTINYPCSLGSIGAPRRVTGYNFVSAKFQIVDASNEVHYCEITGDSPDSIAVVLGNLHARGASIGEADLPKYQVSTWGNGNVTLRMRAGGAQARPATFDPRAWASTLVAAPVEESA